MPNAYPAGSLSDAPPSIDAALLDDLKDAGVAFDVDDGQAGFPEALVGRDVELEQLRAQTISSLATYDHQHDTELVDTLREFLLHHGSTTETAEAMQLHRHTVGYRLARVQEVSGLSPYESDGRERLSLGLKADQILAADQRLSQPG